MSPRRAAHLVIALAGLALLVYGLVGIASPRVTCRGEQMSAGQVCHKNDFGQLGTDTVQSYEQRRAAALSSQPVVVVLGALVAAFGAVLYRRETR